MSSYVAGWRDGLAVLGGPGTVLSMSGPGFDVSIGDMTRALAFGQTVVFLPHDEHVTVESLHQTLLNHEVEVAEIVPGMLLRDLAAHCRVAGPVESLRLVISGTDMWTHDALTAAVAEVAPNAVPGNVFGVTEAAIDSIFHAVTEDHPAAVVPIGTPLTGAQAFVVDGSLRPAPVGVPGELLVGGPGLAQGYVGRPDLTAERFVPDVFGGSGGRLYRTGDRARWRADGTIEFLGRVDEQVKIRGYRVEPGEVEVVIGDHPDVRDVVVVARDGGPHGGKRLVAYVVAEGGDVSGSVLRAWLRERVPDYLVPPVFVALERLPLTPNGKVDRRGLPDPEPETAGEAYVAPRSVAEETLAAVWSQVLGVERVGVHDNFFELGGDSILSLQIVARARAAGLGVDVADVFAHQTIAELALAVRKAPEATLAEQGVVTGPVPFTPIQRWFLAQDIPDRDHWNWSGVFELAPGTDPDRLGRALDAVVAHHDALRIRFDADGQYNAPVDGGGFLRVADDQDVVAHMTAAQKSLRLADGPLLAAVFFDRGDEPAWLGLTVHHLVMDGVSWNLLLEDLDTAYRGGTLAPKTTSFKAWSEQLQTLDAGGERAHWVAATTDVTAVPVDGRGPNTEASSAVVQSWLDAETTAALLGEAHKAYRTQGHDLLLTALAQTLGEWAGGDHVTVDLESHGREGADLSRTVGWFTSIFPVRLTSRRDPSAAIKAVKEELRSVPRRGVGYGVLRWLQGELASAPDRPVLFNYLGAFDAVDTAGLIRRELPAELAGPSEGEGGTRSHLLQLEVQQGADGRLSIEWFHSTNLHDTATVERVAGRYVEALRGLVGHCRSAGGFTPSDFPLASLTQVEVDGLAERYPLVDVYRLAPVQSGMLFGVVGAPVDGLYWGQGVYDLAGQIDAARLAAAWREVVARHAPLRSGFVWEGVSEPVQIVLAEVDVPLTTHDWSGLDEAAQQVRLQELLAEDRALGFDLARPPLTRLYLVDRGDGRNWLVWGLYQGLCDGWSLPVVMDEVSAAYQRQSLPPARPYRDYIAWLGQRDPADAEGFWRTNLDGFEAPTPLPADRLAASHYDQDRRRTHLSEGVTAGLVELARRERVTLSTVVQAAWAKVLSASSGEDDVVFGLTVSGRPAELAGVESMVGLFINTLPVRAVVPVDTPFASWLRELQDNQVALQRFEYTPLVDVQRWSAVPHGRALFDSIVVFGNFPQEEQPEDLGGVQAVESVEQGNYPLTFAVDLETTLKIEAEFSTAAFDAVTVERILDQLVVVLTAVAERPGLAVGDVPLQRPEQAAELVAWGRTPEPGAEPPVPDLIDSWAHTIPDAVAVVCGEDSLTFAQLRARADALAGRLQRAGVTVESPVAVLVPRGIDLAVAFHGVLRSGGTYVPINPGLPAERLMFLLEDVGAVAAVTTEDLVGELAGFAGEVLELDDGVTSAGTRLVKRDALAYIAYTSGSTGRPKGVAVTHAALSSYVAGWRDGLAVLGGPGTVLSMSGPGFDVSIGDMTRALAFGQTVVFLPHDEHVTVESLHQTLVAHEVEVAEIVPGMLLRDLAAHCRIAGPVESLRLVISGTDMWTHDALTSAVAEVAPNAVPGNVFGVTEAAIDSIFHAVTEDHPAAVVPIGTPLTGAQAFVVDGSFRPAPVGVPGELLVGGPGVARGYVGRPDLTAERFVPDVFTGSGQRLYRTGDRARWRADGTIEFLGRVDEQVKIRGYRVEPGEVEVVIGDHPDVRDVVVVARNGGPHGGKRLVAYVVAEGEFSAKVLRDWLRERVPDYLVPSVFVPLDRLPLTPNGKVDRRGLPDPEPETTGEAYVAPRNAAEETLAAVWSGVLGVERVGVHDNFFELGGDSILSLQVVARVRAAGLGVDVADVFAHQTVAELALAVRDTPVVSSAEQGVITGPIPFTPIQHWFLTQDIPNRDHWNWSGVFELAAGTDPDRLASALNAVVAHHDALRIRFTPDEQHNAGIEPVDMRVVAVHDDEVSAEMTTAQKSLRLADGPLLAAVFFDRGDEPAWLGLTVHHLVMDGVSWNVLLEDLDTAYDGGSLGPKTTSFQQWAQQLQDDDASAERDHWIAATADVPALPADGDGPNTDASEAIVQSWLDADTTATLLGDAHKAYRTQGHELLLTALAQTLGEWAGTDHVTVDLESHGREGADLSRTVGWFTSIFPARLTNQRDPAMAIKAVKEDLRAVPRRGVGYGVLRWLQGELAGAPDRPVLFNYLGAHDATGDDEAGLIRRELDSDLAGPTEGEGGTRSHLLQLEVQQAADGRLSIEWFHSTNRHDTATIERVAARYVEALRELVEHCRSTAGGFTPSDFPLASLAQPEIDRLAERYPLVDVYRLAPVQSGMLFGVVGSPVDGLYWGQSVYDLAGPIDVERFAAAWREVIARHASLRSGFVWEGVGEPVQVVLADVDVPLEQRDWSSFDEAAQQVRLQELLADDRALGFDVARPPLMRLYLVDCGNGQNWLIWGLYQGLCDGWSLPVVMDEVSAAYQGSALEPTRPYRDFIAWLDGRDPAEPEAFWRTYLGGFEAPTPLPADRLAVSHYDQDRRRTHLDGSVTASLVELARRERVTLSTVVQAAWAKVLSASSGEDDVVFGLTVSGRPAELAGVESMVGLFINTLPIRAVVPADVPFTSWLHDLRDNQVAVQRFEYTPLVDVQRWSAVPHGRALFDSIVVFGNYPQEEQPEDLGGVDAVESVEQGNYPLTFAVDLEATLKIEAEFSTAAFDATTVERILDQLMVVLTAVAERPDLPVQDIPLHRPAQAAQLVEWGSTTPPAAERPVPDLIDDWARTSAEIAVICGDERLTFAELGARADALAARLRRVGVTVESPVAVLAPRGIELAVAFQGVLRSGGVYVPINPGLPAERLAFLLADAGVVAVVTTSVLAGELAGFAGEVLLLEDMLDGSDMPGASDDPRAPEEAPAFYEPLDPNGLAYIAYTSGSTGRPKGVAVTHRALSSYVAGWRDGLAVLGGPGTVLSMSGPGFDVSIGDMTRALAFGQTVVFLPHDEHVTVESLHRTLVDHSVEVAEIVPGMLLRDLAAHCREAGPVKSLRLVISGTDMWTHDALTTAVAEVAPNAVPGNVFGVTEAAIDSIFHPVGEDHPAAVVPIGTPLTGAQAFVVDGSLRPAPVGVPGELLVGGPGLAQGYVGRPDLTAERFVPNVFGAGAGRLYRTGDRARWRADGTIEFLGRVDEQVKIRGYRVEPGEVEVVIGDHPGVRDVVVVARDGGPHGGKRLVAYVVAESDDVSGSVLRAWLRERVPDYLVPSVFVALDRLPLTPNGKVDRRGLPDPEPESTGEAYVAPRTAVEETLAAVWSGVLGVGRVGVHDNFFELGGDSILSLQIVARARAAGLGIDVADVFAHQSVAELAPVVRDAPAATLAEQGVVTGPVPFTPIQRWFLAQDIPDRDHWNWSGMFELAPGTDPDRLGHALDAVVAHHDALRIRFSADSQYNAPVDGGGFLRVTADHDVVAHMTEAQKSLRLADGPLIAAVFFDRGDEPAWLGLTVHHLVMDGVSWNILLEDLDTAYHGGTLAPKTTSFQQWAQQLQDDDASGEREYWVAATADVVMLPVDGNGPNTDASESIVQSWLDADTTATLLGDAHKAYRTQGHDLLLAALAQALGEWAGSDHVTVDLESHGREVADLSRTVGWFTSIFPVRLTSERDPAAAIKAVKEQLREVPRRGVGYGVLRWLHGELAGAPDRPVLFNYLGAHDATGDDEAGLIRRELNGDLAGPSEAEGGTRSHLLQLEVQQAADGRLSIEWFHSTNRHDTATVERVAARYVEALRELAEHCRSTAGGFTPSDFPLANLTQDEIDGLVASCPSLVDAYRLAPVQSGMLFGVVGAPDEGDGLYWGQGVYDLAGQIDAARLAAAWRQVIARHAALRSGFVWEGVSEPVQIVLTDVDVPLEQRDWSGLDEAAQQVRLQELLADDRALGFDLARPPLTRLYLVDRGNGQNWLIWGLYQGLCDGWSLPVVMDEVSAAYQRQSLPPARPYRDYIAWLGQRDPADTEGFWRTYLGGFEAPTALPVDRLAASHYAQDRRRTHLDEDATTRLVELARRERVTLSTVVQAAWAKVLSASSGEDDVVFGLTVSGRPADLAGVESMVGLFINTLPVRAVVPMDTPFTSWLHELRDNQIALQRYEFTPLVDVQRWSAVPHGRGLFDSIVVFGNYPQEEAPADAGEDWADAVESVEQGNYPLTFAVDLEATLKIEAEFSTAAFDATTVERVLDQLVVVLTAVAHDPELAVADLPLQRPEQAAQLVAWGETSTPAAELPVPDLIRSWAHTGAVAAKCGGERLTFAELDARSASLAARLQQAGVTVESPVAVLVPRGVELAVAFQGVLRSGGVYVPINPGLPAERLAFLLADAGAVAAVTTTVLAGELAAFSGPVLVPDDTVLDPSPVRIDPDALAYIAYTSGSTGRPKGVAVTHGALSSYVAGWRAGLADVGGPGVVLSMSGPGFDVSIGDMTRALAFGQTVVFLPHDEHVSVESLHGTLSGDGVAIAEIVPGMLLRDLAAHCRTAGPVESLRLVISGTDMWTHDALTTAVAEVAPNAVPGNVFGVTEAAIDSIFHPVGDDHPHAVVPIGTPLAGARAVIVDDALRPAPVGVPGELLVGGPGVARGYVNRPDLTAERFVPDIFGVAGGRLYRTGDRARWRADGTIEFLGRVDEQVKIRGYRVEPGEVEVVIGDHPDVRDVVVVARDGGAHGGKRLVAYVVAEGEFSAKVLRDWLRERVPDYLVPSVFVPLDRLPLTPNGKVDRKGLPAPEPESAAEVFEAPRTSVEDTLAVVWSQVLGLERVGVHDNFFELGGDSILSLQIVARTRAAGLGVDVADVFAHQTIAELAPVVRDTPALTLAEQGVVTGPVPLTPIQHWFVEQNIPDRDHWNWSGVFELATGTDPDRLARALDAVVGHHDALRIRFRQDGDTRVQDNDGELSQVLRVVTVKDDDEVIAHMTEAQTSLRLADGPLVAAVYFDRGAAPAWLGLTAHHFVMDGVAWNILLEDLDTAYQAGPEALGPKTTSFQQWAEVLHDDNPEAERDHWAAQTERVTAVPVDGHGANTEESADTVRTWLDAKSTEVLLGEAHKAYRTQINDLLLAALLKTLGEWAGTGDVTIDLESHGREAIADGVDLSRTVGWFTSIFPVRLRHRRLGDSGELIKAVKEQLRAVPRRGVGYGILRYLRRDDRLVDAPARPVLFNYLGAFDAAGDDAVGLIRRELPADLCGPTENEQGNRSHLLQIEAEQTSDGRLLVEWYFSTNVHRPATVERLATRYVNALRELVEHCQSGAGGVTPSDFPLANIDQASLAAVLKQMGG
ncbi:non-ribosomal peptide synthase/polyketide synthase [Lentzea atacamensis]|uniref:non-ribosomal peptide synthase/polyketide synthase n=1 Tax=Lentzea atacamensis TaxID=531938 RepID=UPI00389958E5